MASRAILSNFCEEQRTQNHPQYLSGLSRALYANMIGAPVFTTCGYFVGPIRKDLQKLT